jgi:Domain of unknown function (DUF4145)
MFFLNRSLYQWLDPRNLQTVTYSCGYCNYEVATDLGYGLRHNQGFQKGGIYICPNCLAPTFITPDSQQFPSTAFGKAVDHVPEDLYSLYEEARRCTAQNCYTAAVLLCRKMLMNIAVAQGAEKNLRFIEYVNYLSDKGFTPPNGKHWVDHIRKKGNEATHEIELMKDSDAKELILFIEMLLKFIYEFPALIPVSDET